MGRIVDADPADLDDISQEAFVAIHRMLPGFEGRSSLETWLNAVAWRVASHYHRRSHARFETMQG
jgi:RNA polymerase sigma-70 factor (ECF subfamily)